MAELLSESVYIYALSAVTQLLGACLHFHSRLKLSELNGSIMM